MTGGSFRYLVKQGLANIWLNRLMTAASIGILTACLILIGGAALVSLNVRDIFHSVEGQNELVIFIEDDATGEEIGALESRITALPEIASHRFESKDEALRNAIEQFDLSPDLTEEYLLENPMPASFRVTLHDISAMSQVMSAVEGMPSVYQVDGPTDVADTLTGLERVLLIFGGIIILILIVASVVVISNSIRLTVFARRREISIMKYVGATNGFIRLPFVVEGVMVGAFAAFCGFGLLYGIYAGILRILADSTLGWVSSITGDLIPFAAVWWQMGLGFLIFGVLIGAMGSSSAMRKYLKV